MAVAPVVRTTIRRPSAAAPERSVEDAVFEDTERERFDAVVNGLNDPQRPQVVIRELVARWHYGESAVPLNAIADELGTSVEALKVLLRPASDEDGAFLEGYREKAQRQQRLRVLQRARWRAPRREQVVVSCVARPRAAARRRRPRLRTRRGPSREDDPEPVAPVRRGAA